MERDAEALLQFEDFKPTSTSTSGPPPSYEQTITFSKFPTSQVDIDIEDEEAPAGDEAAASAKSGPSFWSFGYYQQYFDVDTPQVKDRLVWSFVPRPSRDILTNYIRPTPDLYGPFWICATLVFCIAIMGNVADYLHSGGQGRHWRYDFRKVSISGSAIFSYAVLLPLLLWLLLWWRQKKGDQYNLAFTEIVCLYGYSLAIYVPVSVLWTIPVVWLQWAFVIVAATLSGSVLVLALWGPLSSGGAKGMAVAILAAILFCHLLLAAGLQLYFFRYDSPQAVTVSSGSVDTHPALNASQPLAALSQVLDAKSQRPITENNLDDRRPLTASTSNPSSQNATSTQIQSEEKKTEPVPAAKDPQTSKPVPKSTKPETTPSKEPSAQQNEHKPPGTNSSSYEPALNIRKDSP